MWKEPQDTDKVVKGSKVYNWHCFLIADAMSVDF